MKAIPFADCLDSESSEHQDAKRQSTNNHGFQFCESPGAVQSGHSICQVRVQALTSMQFIITTWIPLKSCSLACQQVFEKVFTMGR